MADEISYEKLALAKANLLSLKTRVSHFASTLFTAHIDWAAGRLGSKQVGCEVAYTRL